MLGLTFKNLYIFIGKAGLQRQKETHTREKGLPTARWFETRSLELPGLTKEACKTQLST